MGRFRWIPFVGFVCLPLSFFFYLSSLILSHGTLLSSNLCDPFFCTGYTGGWIYHSGCVYPPTSETLSSTSSSSSAPFSYGRIMFFTLVFLSKVNSFASGRSWLLSKGFLTICNLLYQFLKCHGFHLITCL
jgi:hypothetical protein